ncbi:sperm microtubule inner protein 11 [Cetorhinus maximus]
MSREECQVHGEPMLRLLPDASNPYLRTEQECLEDMYFGRRPAICDASTPLESMPYHNKSVEQYTHMKMLGQLPKAPNMMYRVPLTTGQQYGWWLPRDPNERLEKSEPWTSVVRYPLANSEMTRYVDHMTLTNPEFSLF